MTAKEREITVREGRRVPWIGALLGYAAMVPLAAAALVALLAPAPWPWHALDGAQLWSGALLAFFAGVRRGVSFRTEGGPRLRQLATMLTLFGLAVATLALPVPRSLGAALAGFVLLWLTDPPAARRGEVPLYFARLRPLQMLVPIASLAVLLGTAWGSAAA